MNDSRHYEPVINFYISKETVKSYIKNIYQKLAVNSKFDAIKIAEVNKWLNKNWS